MDKKNGRFGWNELMTSDMERAKKFYTSVLGWEAYDVQMSDPTSPAKEGEASYTLWKIDNQEVGGAMKLEGPGMEDMSPRWMSYVNVADVDKVVEKVLAHGGKVVAGPMDIESVGRFFIIKDPQGAVLGLGTSTMVEEA
ncbi:MAG: VOC family protein [Hyphomicrobiaceae bacterium]|nr:VOC family protein [Hyphomicrobiaceae bacterium]